MLAKLDIMNLLCILISFALVGNVLVTKLDDYIELVLLINDDIRQAKAFMPQIIKNMVSNYDDYEIEGLSFMLAVPDYIDIKVEAPESDSDFDEEVYSELGEPEQYRIPFVNLAPGEGSSQIPDLNLDPPTVFEEDLYQDPIPDIHFDQSTVPEEDLYQDQIPEINLDQSTVPEEGPSQNKIPDLNLDPSTVSEEVLLTLGVAALASGSTNTANLNQDQIPLINLDPEEGPSQRQIPELNLDPSSVPEEESKKPKYVGKTTVYLGDKIHFQKMMKSEILFVTNRAAYDRMMETTRREHPGRIEIPTIKLENLASILEARRIHPTAVPRNRVVRVFRLDSLARARREMTLEAITKLIGQNDPLFRDLYMMCRLVGAFRSIKYPRSYITSASLDEDEEHCILDDMTFTETYLYKFVDGEFWELDPRLENHPPIRPFLSELE